MTPPKTPGPRLALAAGLAAALLTGLLWPLAHPALPLMPTDDLYTHLTVARHLARGDGFLCDVAYPLSFAWPFARALPQPLVHRPPAWPVALLLPYAAAHGDPARTTANVRTLQVAVLALVAGLGTAAWVRRGRTGAAAAWLVALAACPLLPYAIDWGHTELPAAALLLGSWLRHRDGTTALGPVDGLLTGLLALLRPELAWLPAAWWLAARPRAAGGGPARATGRRRGPLLALAVAVLLVAPWAVRNARLTGDPFFSVQAAAEVVKDTRAWPGYEVYRQLEPQPAWRALREDPGPVLRKVARGLRFYAREWPALLPWPSVVLLAVAALSARRSARRPAAGPAATAVPWWRSPPATALASVAGLAALYAPLDHSLRHLLVVAPVVAWEAAPWLGEWPWTLWPRRRAARRPATAAALAGLGAVVVALPVVLLSAREPTGWAGAAREAVAAQDLARREAAQLRATPPDQVPFVQTAAAPWLADRAAVWSPRDEQTAARIRAWLEPLRTPPGAP